MYQSTTNDIIRFRCLAAHATTALDATCDAKILDKATGRLEELVALPVVSNGTTPVTLSTAPATGKNKAVEGARIVNLDTSAHTVIVEWHNGTITRRQHTAVLQSGESLVYAGGDWSVYSPSGKEILVGETGDPGTNGTNGADGSSERVIGASNLTAGDPESTGIPIWYDGTATQIAANAIGGTADVDILVNGTLADSVSLASGANNIDDLSGYTIPALEIGDIVTFELTGGTATAVNIAMIVEADA